MKHLYTVNKCLKNELCHLEMKIYYKIIYENHYTSIRYTLVKLAKLYELRLELHPHPHQ